MKRRTFDEKFKKMIVDLYHNGTPALVLSDEYGIQNSLIYKWIKSYGENSTSKLTYDKTIELKLKVKTLEKQLKQKEMEVDILKKASAIFIAPN